MKTTFTFILCAISLFSQGQSAGPFAGSEFGNVSSGGQQTWTNEANISSSDNSYALIGNIPGPAGSYSDFIVATGFNFDLPDGVTVQGIKVDMERSDPNQITADYMVRIVKGGTVAGTNLASGTLFPATDGTISYGGPAELWGESISYKDIDNNNFGVAVSVRRMSDIGVTDGRIDHIQITVYYSFTTLPVQLVMFNATRSNETVRVDWNTETESGIAEYVLERSADGRSFQFLNSVASRNQAGSRYSITDFRPFPGTSYYRLKIREQDGSIKYSSVASISISAAEDFRVSPSPWSAGQELFVSNPRKEKLSIHFFNEKGEKLAETSTQSRQVPTPNLGNNKGVVYYKVFDQEKRMVSKGNILVY
jgi:hypothetical protein